MTLLFRTIWRLLVCSCILLCLLLVSANAFAIGSSVNARRVLAIGRFNTDSTADTLIGEKVGRTTYLPLFIFWGGSSAVTSFSYPVWDSLRGSTAVAEMSGDSLQDILFFVQGRTGLPVHDTTRAILLYGQSGLEGISQITVASISLNQSSPFAAKEMVASLHFVARSKRDLSENNSYLLLPEAVAPPKLTPPPHATEAPVAGELQVYPNPTVQMVTLRGEHIPSGEYHVSILTLLGKSIVEQELRVDASGDVLKSLDVHGMASGQYLLRVRNSTGYNRIFTIIIQH